VSGKKEHGTDYERRVVVKASTTELRYWRGSEVQSERQERRAEQGRSKGMASERHDGGAHPRRRHKVAASRSNSMQQRGSLVCRRQS